MNNAYLLDCTLRDGAYLIDKNFGDSTIHGIVNGLLDARVDFIEIGFLQDEGFGEGKTVFKGAKDAGRFVPADKKNSEFTVLADYSRYSISNLEPYDGTSIDGVRECFFKEERFGALEVCRTIKKLGYKLFVQPVDILGYTDKEIISFIEEINEIEPYSLSIVDTFGSMYEEDLQRIYSLIEHNLTASCKIGFHSHNNMQMSNALTQSFLRMSTGRRGLVVDGTISGMGRGAGNTPTELIAQYMVAKLNYNYNMEALLDIIDEYMDNIRNRCSWGYTTPYFLAGCYSAHVNNVTYLAQKNSIQYKDIRYILNKIGTLPRKRYDYELLEKTYMEYLASEIDDSPVLTKLGSLFEDKNVVIVAPGRTVMDECEEIKTYVEEKDAVVIGINFIHPDLSQEFLYMNNAKRYDNLKKSKEYTKIRKILTSNLCRSEENGYIVSFAKLIKCGWSHVDNSALMLLRLLDNLGVKSIAIAGMDGYSYGNENYANSDVALANYYEDPKELNLEIQEMLDDYMKTRRGKADISFITESKFCLKKC